MLEHIHSPLFQVLLAIVAIMIVTKLMGTLFKNLGQPPVMGEIIGGILLGPSFLGLISPGTSAFILPQTITPQLNIIAQIGILLYLFLVGLEIDLDEMKKSVRSTIIISNVSVLFPFVLGLSISRWLYESTAPEGVNFPSFSLFVGVSLSVTAFPVLARILTDQNLHKTKLGILALTCAAVDDITAWCLLALVLSFASAQFTGAIVTIICTILYVIIMLFIIRPFLKKKLASTKDREMTEHSFLLVLTGLLMSALVTELIGIHALFGAFLFGVIFPHDHSVAKSMHHRLNEFVRLFFLPVFFAFTGMRTKINLVSSPHDWLLCAVIILTAVIGKFGGTYIAARISGYKSRQSAALGILMNTRGLVELIVLNVGLDMGVISPTLYTMLVIMALVTTLMTGPLMKILNGREHWEM